MTPYPAWRRIIAAEAILALCLPVAAMGGSYELASMLRIRDIIPGTEQVRLLPDGGFERGGEGWKKKGGRWGQWTVGPHVAPAPGVCGRMAVHLDAATGSGSHQIDGLPPYQRDWCQVFSGYIWLPGADTVGAAPGVPGEQHVCFFRPVCYPGGWTAYAEGCYIFGDFRPHDRQTRSNDRVSYNIKGGIVGRNPGPSAQQSRFGFRDKAGQWRSVVIMGDNLADTPIVEFAPPVLRYAAIAESSDLLAIELRRTRLLQAGQSLDADAAIKALREKSQAEPLAARWHNALAEAYVVRFARNLEDYDSCKAAMSEWESSLRADPDQPLVSHRLRLYRGYIPAQPFTPGKPPADLPPDPKAAGLDGPIELASYIRLREIMPGTERVTLVPNGDFEAGPSGWTATPGRDGLHVARIEGLQTRLSGTALFRGNVLYAEAPLPREKTEIQSAPMNLDPGDEYVVSAWIAPLGEGDDEPTGPGAIAVGFAGEGSIAWGYPIRHAYTAHEGLFVFGTVKFGNASIERRVRISVGPWLGKGAAASLKGAAAAESRGVGVIIDNVAVTRASEFRPPVFRAGAHLEFLAMLGSGTAGAVTASVADLESAAKQAPRDARARNRLAAACMVEFLRDPAREGLLEQAMEEWKSSLGVNADQPDVQRQVDVWAGYRQVPSALPHPYAVPGRP